MKLPVSFLALTEMYMYVSIVCNFGASFIFHPVQMSKADPGDPSAQTYIFLNYGEVEGIMHVKARSTLSKI